MAPESNLMKDSLRVDLDRLRSIKGMKWTKYEKDVLPAFVADMDFEPPNSAFEALKEMVDMKDFGYKFNHIDHLIPAWTNWISNRDGLKLPEAQCAVFTSSIHALEAVMVLHTNPNDGVALFSPVYHPFAKAVKSAGRKLIDIPLLEEGITPRHARPMPSKASKAAIWKTTASCMHEGRTTC